MNNLLIILVIFIMPITLLKAQTTIDQSYFAGNDPVYVWDMGGSPYYIKSDLLILDGSDLIIEPGVDILFLDFCKIDVKGSINAIGNSNERITFSSNNGISWNGIRFDFSDGTQPTPSKLHYCDISNARKIGTSCTTIDPESSGGAVFVDGFSDLEIIECKIFMNGVLGQGGAIGLYNNSNPIIRNCNIYGNSAKRTGGGICMMRGCNPEIIGNVFQANESITRKGGAIGIGDTWTGFGCSPSIINNYIVDNYAGQTGGGVFICHSNITEFNGNTFEANSSNEEGGAIYINGSIVEMSDNTFSDNYSNLEGGGIYLGYQCELEIYNSSFTNNKASTNGGGIYIYSSATATINNCSFEENLATNGGGIYALKSISIIENCSFEANTATANGGGIYMNDPYSSKINLNKFISNNAYQGSALYYYRDNSSVGNYAEETRILNNLFVENYASDIGVVYLQGNNNNTIFNHNTISNNTSVSIPFTGVCVQKESFFPNYNNDNFVNNIIYEFLDILAIEPTPSGIQLHSDLITKNLLQIDPNFVSVNDYHLTASSPCIDMDENSAVKTTYDLDGNNRTYNGDTDYGCYESSLPSPPIAPNQKNYIDDVENSNKIEIYPNPASDVLNITVAMEGIYIINIYDINGQKVFNTNSIHIVNSIEIPINNLTPGNYMLNIQTGSKSINKKIVVQ